ncbi:MAG: molybdopterin oxidoreductase family protein [Actinomycetota bacterium]
MASSSGRVPGPEVTTHCPYCALNCGVRYQVADGRIGGPRRWKASPLTAGALCSKGATAHQQVDHPERLRAPLVREGRDFAETTWEEALDRAAEGFLRIAGRCGPDANAVLSGGSLTNEKVYLVGKLARLALGTANIDYNGRFCMTSAGAANKMAFGADRMMTPLDELRRADVVVVAGANLSAAFPVVVPTLLEDVRRRGGTVIVVDPRRSRFVRDEDLHLAIAPGTDAVLFNGLLREIGEQGWYDVDFLEERTRGFVKALDAVEPFSPEMVAARCDVDAADVRRAAALLGATSRVMYLHGRGPEQQVGGVQNVLAIINLGLACGHVGGPGRGINMLTGQRNGQGGREWGQRCDQLPAGRRIDDVGHRATVAEHWGVDPDRLPGVGRTYVEILQAAGTDVRGLLAICTNMSVSAPDLHEVERRLSALDHLVVIDPFFSASALHADVVLPGTTFTEEEGTITTIEGRVVRCDQATEPVSGRSDLDLLNALADRLGAGRHFGYESGREVFAEMCRVSAGGPVDYSGMTWDRVRDEGGLFWPCPEPDHPGTPQLYREHFAHPDGRARLHPVVPPEPVEPTGADRPLVLTTGRVLAQYLSGNQTMRIAKQNALAAAPVLEVHPETAAATGLIPDRPVTITSALGSSTVAWTPNGGLRPDTVFLPYHWPACNRLVAAHLDPVSRIPAFKYTPVSLSPAPDESPPPTAAPPVPRLDQEVVPS